MSEREWRFDPHVGEGTLHGLRILVVGESHYLDGFADEDFKASETQDIVAAHGVGLATSTARTPVFRKLAATLATPEISGGEVWRRVSYYNYFQRVMEDARDPPTVRDYEDSQAPFDAVLRWLKPEAVLVISGRLWEDMRNESRPGGRCELGAIYNFTAAAELIIPAAHTLHPSAPFRVFEPLDWQPRVQDFFRVVREGRDSA